MTRRLRLKVLAERFAVCRLPPDSPVPPRPSVCGLWSVTLTGRELSIVLPEAAAPAGYPVEPGWRALEVAGPLDLSLTGVMSSLSTPLAAAGVSVFVVSTYDTDYVLVRETALERAEEALREAGHEVETGPGEKGPATTFKDHFSGHAADYASFRPGYPPALFERVAALPRRREVAWDCGTGNGQAAVGLAQHFSRVVATDPSAQQLAHALPHPRVEYRQASAERSGLAAHSVDLVAAAQAFHWFDFEHFFAEARRVLAPGGAVVLWTYNLARVSPEVDAVTDRLARRIAGPYWPPERRWVDEEYRTIPFPFPEVEVPPLEHAEQWNLERFLLYIGTWSACKRYQKAKGQDPIALVRADLEAAWGPPDQRRAIRWPIFLRASQPIE